MSSSSSKAQNTTSALTTYYNTITPMASLNPDTVFPPRLRALVVSVHEGADALEKLWRTALPPEEEVRVRTVLSTVEDSTDTLSPVLCARILDVSPLVVRAWRDVDALSALPAGSDNILIGSVANALYLARLLRGEI